MKSPCVRICSLNEDNVCVGCGMTVRDLRIWRGANDEEKQQIVTESSLRLKSVRALRDEGLSDDGEK